MPRGAEAPEVLFMNTTVAIGGTNRLIQSLVRGCAARGIAARFALPDAEGAAETVRWLAAEGVSAERTAAILPMERPHGTREIAALRAYIRRTRADIVNLHYGLSYISFKDVLAARLAAPAAARRVVASVHCTTPWSELGPTKQKMTRLAARLCHAVVVTTPALGDIEREAGVAPEKIAVVPAGAIVRAGPSRPQARRQFGLPEDAFVIGCVSRLVPEKRVADLIGAAAGVRDAWLLVAGAGAESESLRRQSGDLMPGRAVFAGHLADPTPVYAASDVFALTSENEGFGIVFCEAALQGVPSVATAVGGIPYVVADGQTGLLAPPGDVPALTAALQRLRGDHDLRGRLGAAARARALREFTEDAMVERYLRVLGLPSAAAGSSPAQQPAPANAGAAR